MPNWRRAFVAVETRFFAVVTVGRRPIFGSHEAQTILGTLIPECKKAHPFNPRAIVLLADHLHAIWRLLRGVVNDSLR
jgi:putative transposase